MKKNPVTDNIYRIIDANINRANEGLRVCEEITRFILGDHKLTSGLKKIRHRIKDLTHKLPAKKNLLSQRDTQTDIGKNVYVNELKRRDIPDIFFANIQRVKESIRALEEFSKLIDTNIAVDFKKMRYNIYELEKKIAEKIPVVRNTG